MISTEIRRHLQLAGGDEVIRGIMQNHYRTKVKWIRIFPNPLLPAYKKDPQSSDIVLPDTIPFQPHNPITTAPAIITTAPNIRPRMYCS